MEIRDILYSNLLRLCKELTIEGASFEQYYNDQEDEKKERLLQLADEIDGEIRAVQTSRLDNSLHRDYGQLTTSVHAFRDEFVSFPNGRITEILVLLIILTRYCNSIEAEDEPVLTQDVDVSLFALAKLEKDLYEDYFIYFDNSDISNSIILLNVGDTDGLQSFLDGEFLNEDLTLQLMAKIGLEDEVLENSKYVLVKQTMADKSATIWASLALHILKEGKYIHEPYSYTAAPSVSSHRTISIGSNYQQFNDTLIILSEYNYHEDILNKYLRLYHVLENFMFKYPLVSLERKHAGTVFSIRDFQRMYDKVNKKELPSLTKLFRKLSTQIHTAGVAPAPDVTFSSYILSQIHQIKIVQPDEPKINHLFRYLRLTKGNDDDLEIDDIIPDNAISHFSALIYSFRNSIVHNRETEFHLTHSSLLNHSVIEDTCKTILQEVIIPTLEEIVYFLVLEENDIVWFNSHSLKLWEQN